MELTFKSFRVIEVLRIKNEFGNVSLHVIPIKVYLRKRVSIKIPEGFTIMSVPEPIKLGLPNNLGSFMFNVQQSPTGLSIVTDFKMNVAIVPTQNYKDLKEFYSQRILKETEKVVLKKL